MADEFWSVANPANMGKPTGIKDPNATIDIPMSWAPWLTDIGDSIKSYVVLVDAPLQVVQHGQAGGVVTAFISGGVVGAVYPITFRITTNSTPSRVDDRTVYLFIQER